MELKDEAASRSGPAAASSRTRSELKYEAASSSGAAPSSAASSSAAEWPSAAPGAREHQLRARQLRAEAEELRARRLKDAAAGCSRTQVSFAEAFAAFAHAARRHEQAEHPLFDLTIGDDRAVGAAASQDEATSSSGAASSSAAATAAATESYHQHERAAAAGIDALRIAAAAQAAAAIAPVALTFTAFQLKLLGYSSNEDMHKDYLDTHGHVPVLRILDDRAVGVGVWIHPGLGSEFWTSTPANGFLSELEIDRAITCELEELRAMQLETLEAQVEAEVLEYEFQDLSPPLSWDTQPDSVCCPSEPDTEAEVDLALVAMEVDQAQHEAALQAWAEALDHEIEAEPFAEPSAETSLSTPPRHLAEPFAEPSVDPFAEAPAQPRALRRNILRRLSGRVSM